MAFEVEVDYRALKSELRSLGDSDLKRELADANKEIAQAIVDKAAPRAPVRSGRLKATLRAQGNQAGAVGKLGSAAVPYAAAIHWGRKRGGVIEGRPFLREAANALENDAVRMYEKRILGLLHRVFGR